MKKKEKKLSENLLIVGLIALLMSMFVTSFFKQEANINRVGFDAAAQKFLSNVISIRAQWHMDGKPTSLVLKEHNQPDVLVRVNEQGAVTFDEEANQCQKLWRFLMATDLKFMNENITVIEITNNFVKDEKKTKNICRYSMLSGESFDYHRDSGKVTNIKK